MNTSLTKRTLHYYLREVRNHKKLFIPVLLLLPAAIFLNNYLTVWITSQVINILTTQTLTSADVIPVFLPWIIGFISSLLVGELVLWRLVLFFQWKLETKVVYALNRNSFDTLSEQSMQFHNDRFGGSLVSQVNKFTFGYVRLANTFLYSLMPLILSFTFTFIILGPQLPLFTAALAVLALIFMTVAWFSFRSIRHLNEQESAAQTKLSGQLADSITNILAVKSHGHENHEKDRYMVINRTAQSANLAVMKAVITRDIGFGAVVVMISLLAFVVLIGGQFWFGVPLGTLILASTYSSQILGHLWGFNGILRETNRVFGDSREMTMILDEKHLIVDAPGAKPLKVKNAEIRFDEVNFAHDPEDLKRQLFKSFNLTIPNGQRVGLVGVSGSGKTTLTKLLLRFSDVQSGVITIDGQNIAKITQKSLRQTIAYVPQEPLLFHRSLAENNSYGKPGATPAEIRKAAKQANALDFIDGLKDGFETLVGERGVKLSGGQRQRIAIARAIIKDAPILVLDEATSALDSESEKLIQDALQKLMKGRTSIVIAHRLSTIAKLDRILVMDDGKIIEDGSHAELLEQKGTYARLWSHQSGGFIEE